MPARQGKDKKGRFWQWGSRGKKYYFRTKRGKAVAKAAANRQGAAIHAHS